MSEIRADKLLMKLPIVFDWAKFKGEVFFIGVNFDATLKARKPMVDIFNCATQACNCNVIKTVQWDKSKFRPCKLTKTWNKCMSQNSKP